MAGLLPRLWQANGVGRGNSFGQLAPGNWSRRLSRVQEMDDFSYLASLLLDATIGMAVTWLVFRLLDIAFAKAGVDYLVSGHYFELHKADRRREFFISYRRWFGQCTVWCLVAVLVLCRLNRQNWQLQVSRCGVWPVSRPRWPRLCWLRSLV